MMNKEKTLVELIKELESLTTESDDIKYNALLKGYDGGTKLNKSVYRAELNKYIEYYKKIGSYDNGN